MTMRMSIGLPGYLHETIESYPRPTQRAPDKWESARYISIFYTSGLYCSQAFISPRPRPPLTQAVGRLFPVDFNIALRNRKGDDHEFLQKSIWQK